MERLNSESKGKSYNLVPGSQDATRALIMEAANIAKSLVKEIDSKAADTKPFNSVLESEDEQVQASASVTKTSVSATPLPVGEMVKKDIISMTESSRPISIGSADDGNTKEITEPTTEALWGWVNLSPLSFSILLASCCASCWLVGYFNLNWLVIPFLCYPPIFAYQRSINRIKTTIATDVQKEMAIEKLTLHTETAEWFNLILARFWKVYEPVLSEIIVVSVNDILDSNRPAMIESIRFTEFTLGTESPIINSAKVYPQTDVDVIHLDFHITYAPSDEESNVKRKSNKIQNSKIILTVRLGKGVVGVDIPIMLKEVYLDAKLRIQMKLMSTSPFVKILEVGFLEPPKIDFILKPLKSVDLMDLPFLSNWLNNLIVDILNSVMVNPNMIVLDIDSLVNGQFSTFEKAIGVMKATVYQARHLPKVDLTGSCDPYVRIEINDKVLCKTKHVTDNLNPYWNETLFFLVYNLRDTMTFRIMDFNNVKKHKPLGFHSLALKCFQDDEFKSNGSCLSNVWAKVLKREGKNLGSAELNFDLKYYTIPRSTPVESEKVADKVYNSGILELTVHQGKDLEIRGGNKSLNTFFEVFLVTGPVTSKAPTTAGGAVATFGATIGAVGVGALGAIGNLAANVANVGGGINDNMPQIPPNTSFYYKSKIKKKNNAPNWEESFEMIVQDASNQNLQIVIKDVKELMTGANYVGEIVIPATELLKPQNAQKDWFSLRNATSGRVRLNYKFTGVDYEMSRTEGQGNTSRSIGLLMCKILCGKAMKNGRSDYYLKLILSSGYEDRTKVGDNSEISSEPIWNENIIMLVKSPQELLTLKLFDENNLTRDTYLGFHDFPVKSVLDKPKETHDLMLELKTEEKDPTKRKPIGQVKAEMTYYPALDVASLTSLEALDITKHYGILQVQILEALNIKSKGFIAGGPMKSSSSSYCEVFLNDWAEWGEKTGVSKKAGNPSWNESFEFLIYDPQNSKMTLILKEAKEIGGGTVLGTVKLSVMEIVEDAKSEPKWYSLKNAADEEAKIQLRWSYSVFEGVAVDSSLSSKNAGVLEVTISKAVNLIGVDDDGYSDPYFVVKLDGERVHKSKVIKDTIEPNWNESFEISVTDYQTQNLQINVKDWNQMNTSIPLGNVIIPLSQLTPGKPQDLVLPLQDVVSGSIFVRLYFSVGFEMKDKSGGFAGIIVPNPLQMNPARLIKKTISSARKSIMINRTPSSDALERFTSYNSEAGTAEPSAAPSVASSRRGTIRKPNNPHDNVMEDLTEEEKLPAQMQLQAIDLEIKIESAILENANYDSYVKIKYLDKTVFKTHSVKKTANPVWNESFTLNITKSDNTLDPSKRGLIRIEVKQPKGVLSFDDSKAIATKDWDIWDAVEKKLASDPDGHKTFSYLVPLTSSGEERGSPAIVLAVTVLSDQKTPIEDNGAFFSKMGNIFGSTGGTRKPSRQSLQQQQNVTNILIPNSATSSNNKLEVLQ